MTRIVTGYYGSGKTEFCVNLALDLANDTGRKSPVVIADLDIINPYFRSREAADRLADSGVVVMGDHLDNNTGQDLPALSTAFVSKIRKGEDVIIDLGGGELGSRVISAFRDAVVAMPYDFLCVLNPFRPDTNNAEKMADFVHMIGRTTGISVTGVVNNGHMLHDTTVGHILYSQEIVGVAAEMLKLPIKYTLLRNDLYGQIGKQLISENILTFDKLQMRQSWQ
ncbi:MAG: hypothetical protein FWE33_03830 [Defluviitaleaceae bacterium]|nr:hypothetical protein [Defluviitaleaceae bacterium]